MGYGAGARCRRRRGTRTRSRWSGSGGRRAPGGGGEAAEEELADDPTSIPLPMEQPPNVTERPMLHQTYVEAEGGTAAVDTRPVKSRRRKRAASAALGFHAAGATCAGTAGGGVVVWHGRAAGAPHAQAGVAAVRRRQQRALSWSADQSELVAVDAAGHARVWGCGGAGGSYALTAARSASFWVMSEAKEAADELAAAQRGDCPRRLELRKRKARRERMRAMKLPTSRLPGRRKAAADARRRPRGSAPSAAPTYRSSWWRCVPRSGKNPQRRQPGGARTPTAAPETAGQPRGESGGGFFDSSSGGGGDGPKGRRQARARAGGGGEPAAAARASPIPPSFTLLARGCSTRARRRHHRKSTAGAERVVHSRPLFCRGARDRRADEGALAAGAAARGEGGEGGAVGCEEGAGDDAPTAVASSR